MDRHNSSRCCEIFVPAFIDRAQPRFRGMRAFKLASVSTSAIAIALLGAMALPTPPAVALHRNNYNKCTYQLLEAGLSAEVVSGLCARSLHPEDLASCVLKINQKTDITARDAIATCAQVRRPIDLATCVVDISQSTQASFSPAILENCRRSLLPARYGQCVVGLTRQVELIPTQAMAICIDAGDRIRDLDPTFIPQDALPVQPVPKLPPVRINPSTPI